MTITYELNLENFNAWSGAVTTLDRIRREGKCDELEAILEYEYPEGMTETELNDLLWFEPETVYDWLGMRTEEQIREEIEECEDRMKEIEAEFEETIEDYISESEEPMTDEDITSWRKELWYREYSEEYEELGEKLDELEEELENI